ncbi:Clavaminate synthase-like protein [Lentinula raphanica]|uniref:Clavaminate synthase-like protein n=1 Tax=Lentinula raphanica TaxID=153919 RepID=A0AA38UCX3_9AGAR|nr:Clavaminate synthase-like protein [Lentinula raphanica]KAJ3836820.1 Clavaminate synthase-like protein [Lentinula raphanica]KAJ3972247.1 Clavaminate synthase-like protein [Lentinula raphanica]
MNNHLGTDIIADESAPRAWLKWFSSEYHELNGNHIDVLENSPSALEFARLVQISRPVLIKDKFTLSKGQDLGVSRLSNGKWSNDYLISAMGSRLISVAVTPNGRADAVTLGPDGKLFFAEPAVEKMTMESLLDHLTGHEESNGDDVSAETFYLQSQNGNVYSSRFFQGLDDPSEFEPLRQRIPSEVKWCTEALDRPPDAVNIWIGDGGSVSSVHSDPYENIYTVVRGEKHFTLLPPTDGLYLDERYYPHASYVRGQNGDLTLQPSPGNTPLVRWSSNMNPHLPGQLPPEAHPIHISVSEGETLYIPVGWWHHVRQSGTTVALNWWYDTEMRGMSWVMLSYLRAMKHVPLGNPKDEENNERVN